MGEYDAIVHNLFAELGKTEIVQNFKTQQTRVMQVPGLTERIDEFRKRNYELQANADGGFLFDEVDRFEGEFEELRRNPIVNDYLAAELAFCRMYQEITEKISSAFAVELDW